MKLIAPLFLILPMFMCSCMKDEFPVTSNQYLQNPEYIKLIPKIGRYRNYNPYYYIPQGKLLIKDSYNYVNTVELGSATIDFKKYNFIYIYTPVSLTEIKGFDVFINHHKKKVLVNFTGFRKRYDNMPSAAASAEFLIPALPSDYQLVVN